ncbi:Costars family protein [Platanthera zijinensis]|uniref:Costars family protein n=1 Tax=Platanthera zijinensis TaxID=2320716 RepID=A0AAP0AYR5_9ASPA
MNVDEEVGRLKEEIRRLGQPQLDGSVKGCPELSVSRMYSMYYEMKSPFSIRSLKSTLHKLDPQHAHD